MRFMLTLGLFISIVTFGSLQLAHADTHTEGERLYVCNATDNVNFVEGLADPLRLVLGLLGELRTTGYFDSCWFNVKRRIFDIGTPSYYLGLILVLAVVLAVISFGALIVGINRS